jgi:uncharacterized Zn finger protein (UPF0148 family)
MTKKFCKKCGNALTKTGAKFCATCGATLDGPETDDVSNKETRALPGEKTDQIVPATQALPATTSTSYATEEMPRTVVTAQTEDRGTEVIEAISATPEVTPRNVATAQADDRGTEVIEAIRVTPEVTPRNVATAQADDRATEVIEAISATPIAKKPKKHGKKGKEKKHAAQKTAEQPVKQSGGRKKLALAASIGVVAAVAAAAAFVFINSRRASEAQAVTQVANNAEPSVTAQPVVQPPSEQPSQQADQQPAQPSGAVANNQASPQTRLQPSPSISDIKSPAVRNDMAVSKPQPAVTAKPTPTVQQEKQVAGGTHSVEQILDQGKTYLNAGRYQEALQECEHVRKLDPGNKDVYYVMGSAYFKLNQLQQALEAYRQCTSGTYATVSQGAVKNLEKKIGKVSAK